MDTNLPKDPFMLMSFLNMKLRNCYDSLDALCDDLHVSKEEILKTMQESGFEYSKENNKFW